MMTAVKLLKLTISIYNMTNTVLIDDSKLSPTWSGYLLCYLGLGWFTTVPIVLIIGPGMWTLVKNSALNVFVFPLVLFLMSLIFVSAIYPVDRDFQPKVAIQFGHYIIKNLRSYFSFKIEFEDLQKVESTGSAIFVIEPHGVLPIHLFWGSLQILKKHNILCCVSDSIFLLPGMKHILTWCGATSADRMSMIKYLKKGYSLNICPGGVTECKYLGNKDECVLFMKSRKGLTKLALTEGVKLIPSMTFGSHKLYDYWVPKSEWLVNIGRKIGFLPMIFFGIGGLPFTQAKPCPLTVVVGKPIDVPKTENPSDEEINKYHNMLLLAMEELYEKHKLANGMNDIRLVIE